MLNILLIEPFYASSHQQWADGLVKHSSHHINLMTLPGRHWKWRMHGAAITLAAQYKALDKEPDIILTTDFLDVAVFKALSGCKVPIVLYFHENQLTYPWSPTDEDVSQKRDQHYGFINYTSALAADKVLFNSKYHQESFLGALPDFLKGFPDHSNLETVHQIKQKSDVLYLGMDFKKLELGTRQLQNDVKVVLWNHRWEFDKNPEEFFNTLKALKEEGVAFKLIVCGEQYDKIPVVFETVQKQFKDELIHFGYARSLEEYAQLLHQSDVLYVTSIQDFFGISIAEAAYCGATLLLPERLTYPEIYGESAYFYHSNADAKSKLKAYLLGEMKSLNASKKVEAFNWYQQIKEYDEFFSVIVN